MTAGAGVNPGSFQPRDYASLLIVGTVPALGPVLPRGTGTVDEVFSPAVLDDDHACAP